MNHKLAPVQIVVLPVVVVVAIIDFTTLFWRLFKIELWETGEIQNIRQEFEHEIYVESERETKKKSHELWD